MLDAVYLSRETDQGSVYVVVGLGHVDLFPTGPRAARVILRIAHENLRPVTVKVSSSRAGAEGST